MMTYIAFTTAVDADPALKLLQFLYAPLVLIHVHVSRQHHVSDSGYWCN